MEDRSEGDEEERARRVGAAADGIDQAALSRALVSHRDAVRFKRRATRALRALNLTFASWRVLRATCCLDPQRGDVCNHAQVARAAEMYESCVLKAMRQLSRRGWVSHDVDEWRLGFRVIPTEEGITRLALADRAVQLATTGSARSAPAVSPGAAA